MKNSTTYVDVNFSITVRVPVSTDLLPGFAQIGDDVSADISDDVWDHIVNSACDVMDGPDASNVDSIVISEINDDDDPEDTANSLDDYPEHYRVALDWLYDHAEEYGSEEEAIEDCKKFLSAKGYDVSSPECEKELEDAADLARLSHAVLRSQTNFGMSK